MTNNFFQVISANVLQELCHDALLSGLEAEQIQVLASIGGSGTNSKCHRDLLKLFCSHCLIPEPLSFEAF